MLRALRFYLVGVFLREAFELLDELLIMRVNAGRRFFLVIADDCLLLIFRKFHDPPRFFVAESNSSLKLTRSPVSSKITVAS